MKRAQTWGIVVVGGIALAVLAHIIMTPEPQMTVLVKLDSRPSGASVFSGNEFVAEAPFSIILNPGEIREYRLVKRDFDDCFVRVVADDILPSSKWGRWWAHRRPISKTLQVPLTPAEVSALALTSAPSGAVIYMDGRRFGVTPLYAEKLSPGLHTLRLEHADCVPDIFEVTLASTEEINVHRELENKIPAMYRELIAKRPGSLPPYTELITYYVINGDYKNAEIVLRQGFDALKRSDAYEQDEYFTILEKIYARWFEYPEDGEMANIRKLCRDLIGEARRTRVWNVSLIQKHIAAMNEYDRTGRKGGG